MRHTKRIIMLIAVPAVFLAAQTDPPGRAGRLSYINGPVSLQPAGVTDWVDAAINRPLTTGDHIWVGDRGRAEIHVGSTALRLDSNTAFQFLNLNDQTAQIQLSQGTMTVRVRNFGQGQNVEIDTPSLAFTVLHPGEYRVGADPNAQTTTITVRAGDGEVTGGGQTFPVYARQQAVVTGGDQITWDVRNAPGPDGWDQWSSSRDLRADRSMSARYVSREVPGYEDLDDYGRWSSEPGYGQVWRPSRVAEGWSPYHDGHWAWVAPWGWTWVDDAPWGYAPAHYGRWASFGGSWGWVPGPMNVAPCYAPALVGWIGGGGGRSGFSVGFSFGNAEAVGWFPLGPRDPYFPGYNVSHGYFNRVNNTNTTINNTTINNYYDNRNSNNTITNVKYVNQNVRNAVTAVPQSTFASGRPVAQSARAVPAAQIASAHFATVPAIAPQQASVLGAKAGTAASAPRPAANVFSRPVVARTAPPPPPVPFARQQAALTRNPGQPLPPAAVQQMRQSAPAPASTIRVANMAQIQHVQPKLGAGPQSARQAISSPGAPVTPNVAQRPAGLPQPAANGHPVSPAPNANVRPNNPWSAPVARPGAPSPNANAGQQNTPQPNAAQKPSALPSNGTAKGSVQVGRTGAPAPNVNTRQQNAPPPNVAQRPNVLSPNAPVKPHDQWSAPVARPGAPSPNVNVRQQNAPPPNVAQRPNVLSPNAPVKPHDQWSAPVARPGAPSPNVNPRQQNAPPPNVAQRPNVMSPNTDLKQHDQRPAPVARTAAPSPNVNPRQQNAPPPNAAPKPNVISRPPPNDRPSTHPPDRQPPVQTLRAPAPAHPNQPPAQPQPREVTKPQPEPRAKAAAPVQKKQNPDEKPHEN